MNPDMTSNGTAAEQEEPPAPHRELPTPKAGEKTLRARPVGDIERTPESLPVLEAFQEFLDSERRRIRNLMLTLTAFFIAVLVSIVAATLFVSTTFLNHMREDFRDVRDDVDVYREALLKTKNDIKSALTHFAKATSKLRSDVDEEKQSRADAASKIKSRISNYESKLHDMKEVISMLELENVVLKKELDKLKSDWPALSSTVERLLQEIDKPLPQAGTTRSSIVMSIMPRGRNDAMGWRLPIPE